MSPRAGRGPKNLVDQVGAVGDWDANQRPEPRTIEAEIIGLDRRRHQVVKERRIADRLTASGLQREIGELLDQGLAGRRIFEIHDLPGIAA